jgi:hypothetical protein
VSLHEWTNQQRQLNKLARAERDTGGRIQLANNSICSHKSSKPAIMPSTDDDQPPNVPNARPGIFPRFGRGLRIPIASLRKQAQPVVARYRVED